jgi:hypothetical protein
MPIRSDPNAAAKRLLIEQLADRYGVSARFSEYDNTIGIFDLEKFKDDLNSACFVLVDLSLERPSCYYELGVVEALDRPVELVAEDNTPIHQAAGRAKLTYYRDLGTLAHLLDGRLRAILIETASSLGAGQKS